MQKIRLVKTFDLGVGFRKKGELFLHGQPSKKQLSDL